MKLIECPRDAMQGLHDFIETDVKIEYINSLLKVGFDTIDFGSFVSPKAIPQMRDTAAVLNGLELNDTSSKLLAIIANERGATDACAFDEIDYLGFPFSISETFQQRNTNSSIEQSLQRVESIQEMATKHNKELCVYISMAFGNPYGDEWNAETAVKWTDKLVNQIGIPIISLADTVGVSTPESIDYLCSSLIAEFPKTEIGAHLHSTAETRNEKIHAAYNAGCRRLDSAVKGFGGCPMAKDDLVGNMATENLVAYLNEYNIKHNLDLNAFADSMKLALTTFPN